MDEDGLLGGGGPVMPAEVGTKLNPDAWRVASYWLEDSYLGDQWVEVLMNAPVTKDAIAGTRPWFAPVVEITRKELETRFGRPPDDEHAEAS